MSEQDSTTPTCGNTRAHISPNHLEILAARAVTPECAKAAKLFSFDLGEHAETRRKYRLDERWPGLPGYKTTGLAIPYIMGLDKIPRIRVRVDSTSIPNDDGETSTEIGRYIAQANVPVSPYWTEAILAVADDPKVSVFATEAPIKALALTCHFLPALGMGGVLAGAHDPKMLKEHREIVASKELRDRINWRGRKVYIAYDAGITTNVMVALGAAYLWKVLADLGADVHLVIIPPYHPTGIKLDKAHLWMEEDQGPDDRIARDGWEAFHSDVMAAIPANPVEWAHHVVGDKVGQARVAALSGLLRSLLYQTFLHVGGPLVQDHVSAYTRLAGIGKRAVVAAAKESEETLRRRNRETAETQLVRGDQAELAQVLVNELGGLTNLVYDQGDLWRYEGGIFATKDQDVLGAAIAKKAGTPVGESGKPLMVVAVQAG